jgi:acetyl-CoA C-acetyltransferase
MIMTQRERTRDGATEVAAAHLPDTQEHPMKDDIVIVSAARTPVGAFNGAFASLPAHELGKVAIKAALDRAGVEAPQVSEVIMGQILTAGQGQNPARQASIAAGIPVESPPGG